MYVLHTVSPEHQETSKLRLFSLAVSIEFAAIDIFVLLPKTRSGTKFDVLITNHYSNLVKVIPTTKTTVTRFSNMFKEYCVVSFEIPTKVFANNEPQFISKFFATHDSKRFVKKMTTTEYQPQAYEHVEHLNADMISSMR